MVAGSRGRFVGVGVRHYKDARLCELPHAIRDVDDLWRFLQDTFDGEPLRDAEKADIERHLMGSVRGSLPAGGPLVLMWSGHGFPVGRGVGVRLMTADSDADDVSGFGIADVLGPCVRSGADQVLVIVDTCFSGATVPTAAELAAVLLEARPPDADHVWFGVLTSCSASDTAVDGRLGELLRRLLTDGPTDRDLRRRWSEHNVQLRGDDLCDAIIKEWEGDDRRPRFRSDGSAWWMLPNPIYRPGAPQQVVEHLLRAARGGEPEDERSWFTGRTSEVDLVVRWVTDARPGVYVVTGSAGTGKSAVVGRVVSLSDPTEREILLRPGRTWKHADPALGSVRAHAHARALTADRLADLLDGQLRSSDFLAPAEGPRNAAELIGAVQRAVQAGQTTPVLVVDGLDEARGEAVTIATDFLRRLGAWATVIVSTRPVPSEDGTLVEMLQPQETLDLDSAESQVAGRDALRDYIIARLSDAVEPEMDPHLVAALVVDSTGARDRPFLLARVITDQLRAHPVDTSRPGWQDAVAASIESAFEIDLARVEQPAHRELADEVSAATFARTLLVSLTWAFGAGFPEDEWQVVARALSGIDVQRGDISWMLDQLGRYVVQDGEAGVAVYRVAHQSLADHLRRPFVSTAEMIFDPGARPVTAALLARYGELLGQGHGAREPGYLWRYAWRHGTQIGPGGEHADARLVFVAHSMGGLIARRYIECEGGAAHTRKLITLGTPYRGAARAAEQLVNGVRRRLGPLSIDLTTFARSLPSLHQLLPEYACIDIGNGPLLRTTETMLPEVTTELVTDGMRFHDEINSAASKRAGSRDTLHAILGARQPTTTTIKTIDGRAVPIETYRDGHTTHNDYGDATVPTAGGVPNGLPLDTNLVRHVTDQHSNLHQNTAALDEVQEAVTARSAIPKAPLGDTIRARVPDLLMHGEPLTVDVAVESDDRHGIQITTTAEDGQIAGSRTPRVRDGRISTTITALEPGAYTITVTATDGTLPPVTATLLVWPTT